MKCHIMWHFGSSQFVKVSVQVSRMKSNLLKIGKHKSPRSDCSSSSLIWDYFLHILLLSEYFGSDTLKELI